MIRQFFYSLLLALLALADCHALTITVKVGEGGNYFVPAAFSIDPGDTVRWVWVSGHHNTSGSTVPAGAASWLANINAADTVYSFTPMVSGLYTYTCTHHSGMDAQFFVRGCSYPDRPLISSSGSAITCSGNSICLRIAPQAGASYQWINGTTAIAGATADSLPVSTSGNYKVVVNRCGVDSVSPVFPVTVHPLPLTAFTYMGSGLSYSFTNGSSGHLFTWSFGDGSPDEHSLHATHSFSSAGTYNVILTAVDTLSGCSDTFSRVLDASLGLPGFAMATLLVYPNPACDWLQINATEGSSLVLSNMEGRVVTVPIFPDAGYLIMDLSVLPHGLYLLRVSSNKGTGQVLVTH